ncbi:uncharacterized protein [Arachis hypogaea]|uniref:uncharacterized protein isoform X1 n=1 Tax=Arachis hypogaea TaxID=3818 RepID=UPI003B20C55C
MPSPITISPAHTATQVCRRTVSSVAQQAPSRSELRRAITSFDQSPLVSASLSVSHSPYRPAACSVEALKPEGAFEIERKPSSSSLEGAFELPRVPGIYDLMPVKLQRVMFQGLWWSLTGQLSWTLIKRSLAKGPLPLLP